MSEPLDLDAIEAYITDGRVYPLIAELRKLREEKVLYTREDFTRLLDERDAALKRAKELEIRNTSLVLDLVAAAGRLAELEALVVRRHDAKTIGDMGQLDVDLFAEALKIATRRAGRAS